MLCRCLCHLRSEIGAFLFFKRVAQVKKWEWRMRRIETIRQLINDGIEVKGFAKQRNLESAKRFTKFLGFNLPADYFQLLRFSDGLILDGVVCWYGFLESIERLIIFQDEWMGAYWPISDDGCGNYYCINRNNDVVFFDTLKSSTEPSEFVGVRLDEYLDSIVRNELTE